MADRTTEGFGGSVGGVGLVRPPDREDPPSSLPSNLSLQPGGAGAAHGHNTSAPALPQVVVTDYCTRRWMQRVGAQGYAAAMTALAAFVASGKASGKAPRWAYSRGGTGHGARYVTNSAMGGVCVVTHEGSAITVLTREIAREHRQYSGDFVMVQRRRAMSA